jgi:hypothetical protein
VSELARAAGALAPGEDYVIAAAAGATIADVQAQYVERQSGPTKVKVLIMDGGTFDTILRGPSDAVIADVVSTFDMFLARVASDGTVEHVIYFLQPDSIPGVVGLRPELTRLCAESAVPCHFIDLQDYWIVAEHSETIQASEAGAVLIAEKIWEVMQRNCIAQ